MKIIINTNNAAFGGGNGKAEVARILHEIAKDVENGKRYGVCLDINGNKVSRWTL